MYESFTDYKGAGSFPLSLTRSYNSILGFEASAGRSSRSNAGENIGNGWTTNVGAHAYILQAWPEAQCQDPNPPHHYYMCPTDGYIGELATQVTIWHPDGGQAIFYYAGTPVDGTPFTTEPNSTGQLFFVAALPAPATGGGYRYLRDDGYSEYYNGSGQLMAVQNTSGLLQTYTYNGAQISAITDPAGRTLTFTYDTAGRVQTMTNPASRIYTYTYDASGNLSSVTYPDDSNPNGVTVTYKYEDSSFPTLLTGVTDEKGSRYLTWNYDGAIRATGTYFGPSTLAADNFSISYATDGGGKITTATVTEPLGSQRTLTFNTQTAVDQMTSSTKPCEICGDKSTAVSYDGNGYISSTTDFDGNVTDYDHDATGLELSRTEAAGTPDARTITTQWDTNLREPTLITEPGRTTAYTYNGSGSVLTKTVTDTATSVARTTTYTYYSSGAATGLLETVTDPMNNVTSYGYDGQGNLASITDAKSQVTSITSYDANGMPLTIQDPNGVTTTLTYDARQRLTSRTVAGAETRFTYDAVGDLTQATLPTGSYLTYSYDQAHRLTGIADNLGDSIVYTLDNAGNRKAENTYDPSNSLKKTLGRVYNSFNQLNTVTGGASQISTYTDDLNGNTTSIKDPLTNVTHQTFDALNRLSTVVDPESGNTTYNYDPLDRVQEVTDPKGLNTDYTYDAFGDVVTQVSPDTGTTSYTYDLDGNRLTKTDARGVTATYSYDALNRLTGISYPDASLDVIYTYDQGTDGIGHLTGIQDVAGTTAYSYDTHGNTTQKVVTLGTHSFTVGYQYDTSDNLTGMTYPSRLQVSYVRDTVERITSVTANSNPVVSGITYEPFGPITGFTYGNGLTEARTYDKDYRLTGITVPGVLNWSFTDDADDNIHLITDNINGGNSQTLGYDTLNRLTSASGAYGSLGYQYDLDGNRNQQTL